VAFAVFGIVPGLTASRFHNAQLLMAVTRALKQKQPKEAAGDPPRSSLRDEARIS